MSRGSAWAKVTSTIDLARQLPNRADGERQGPIDDLIDGGDARLIDRIAEDGRLLHSPEIGNRPIRVARLGECEVREGEIEVRGRPHQLADDAERLQIQALARQQAEMLASRRLDRGLEEPAHGDEGDLVVGIVQDSGNPGRRSERPPADRRRIVAARGGLRGERRHAVGPPGRHCPNDGDRAPSPSNSSSFSHPARFQVRSAPGSVPRGRKPGRDRSESPRYATVRSLLTFSHRAHSGFPREPQLTVIKYQAESLWEELIRGRAR